jgi:hypothetical protein
LELSQLTHWFGVALFLFSRVAPKKHRDCLVQIIEPNTQDVTTFRLAQLQVYSRLLQHIRKIAIRLKRRTVLVIGNQLSVV